LIATVTETLINSLAPLVVPQLCAAAFGLTLPSRQFLLLSILLATAIFFPMLFPSGSNHFSQRAIALLGLLVLASIRIQPFHPSLLKWPHGKMARLVEMPTSVSTNAQETEHSARIPHRTVDLCDAQPVRTSAEVKRLKRR
jgi:hypothetical protein